MKRKQTGVIVSLLAIVVLEGISQGAVIAYDEFATDVTAQPANGVYQTGLDLVDAVNKDVTGGTIVGFGGTNSWSSSDGAGYYDAYAQQVRLVGRSESIPARVNRKLSNSMAGKNKVYASLALRVAGNAETNAQVLAGFSNPLMLSTRGSVVGYDWDGANWDMVLRYRNAGGATLATIRENVAPDEYNTFYWCMDADADTIKVWVNETNVNATADLVVSDWAGNVSTITDFAAYLNLTGSGNDAYLDTIQLGDAAEDVGMVPELPPAGLLVREEFNTAADADASKGIYDSGVDLGDSVNATVSGGTIIGFDSSTAWTHSNYIEAYAGVARLRATKYSWTYSGRAITNSMAGKTEAYGKVVMRQKLADASLSTGQLWAGFGSSASLGSLGGALVGYRWDDANSKWDLALRYRNGAGVVTAVVAENATNVTQNIYWAMDADADTIRVWVDENNVNAMPTLTVTDWVGTVEEISHLTFGEIETGLSSADFVYVYDIRLGETPESIGMELPPTTAYAEILSIEPFSDTVMKLVVSADHPSLCYPKSAAALAMNTIWNGIAHSTNGVDGFTVTNLDYSAASGADFAIYIEAGQDEKFIKIGSE